MRYNKVHHRPALGLVVVRGSKVVEHLGAVGVELFRGQRMVDACFASEDYREGQAAFMEKRKPQFKGR